jgi:N-glycosylase/DNA lyase
MFRWKWSEGRWLTQDGDLWYQIVQASDRILNVESNGTQGDFRSLFRLELNHEHVIQTILSRGPELSPHIASLRGLRMMRPQSVVETLFSFLCTSNNHISRITGMVNHLASYGVPHQYGFAFPTLESIASISEAELRFKGFGYRAATIPVAAQQIIAAGGLPYLDSFQSEPYVFIRNFLLSLKGVGPKLADCICLYGFDQGKSVPIDTHIWQAITRLYFPEWQGTALTPRKYEHSAEFLRERFGDLAGVAHQFLFVDNLIHWRARKSSDPNAQGS